MHVKLVTMNFGDQAEGGIELLCRNLDDTRAFPGCVSVDVVLDATDASTIHLVEYWKTAADSQAYAAWRAGEGKIVGLGEMRVVPPVVLSGTLRE